MTILRMSPGDLERMRFAYSPLTEAAESLYMVHRRRIEPVHREWYAAVRPVLPDVDTDVLRALIPPNGAIVDFLLRGIADASTSIETQLQAVADHPPELIASELRIVWEDNLSPDAEKLIAAGSAGARQIADHLWRYWQVAIAPYWRDIRALLDADVAYRASRLATGGIEALLADLHPRVELVDNVIRAGAAAGPDDDHVLSGAGLLLVPCAFASHYIIVDPGGSGPPSITYGPRGIGALWERNSGTPVETDALGALLGRNRAAVLAGVTLPRSTTDLACELGQSPAAVSAHLAVLRRCGLVTSWRSGRRVLYQRTPLAASVVAASGAGGAAELGLVEENPA